MPPSLCRSSANAAPPGPDFSELLLQRGPDGTFDFDFGALERRCADSGMTADDVVDGPIELFYSIVAEWYVEHRLAGGAVDPVAELIAAYITAP